MRGALLILAASATLAACATAKPETATPVARAAAAAPEPAPGLDWFFHEDGDWAALAYGVAESDDVRLHLACERAAGVVEIIRPVAAGSAPEIRLESGEVSASLPAKAEPSEVTEGDLLIAQAKTEEPVLRAFERNRWIAVWHGSEREAYAPHPRSVDGVARFFSFCG
jgi:hypothetical protein